MRADGFDGRVIYWSGSGWTELDRALDDELLAEGVRFRAWVALQKDLAPAGSDESYYFYYGRPAAPA